MHPAVLDAVWQTLGAALLYGTNAGRSGPTIPVHVDRIRVWGQPGAIAWSHARPRNTENTGEYAGDIDLLDDGGRLLVETCGLRLRSLDSVDEHVSQTDFDDWLYEMKWPARPRSSPRNLSSISRSAWVCVILAGCSGVGQKLAQLLAARGETDVLVDRDGPFERLDDGKPHYRLWCLDSPEPSATDIPQQAQAACVDALSLIQALASGRRGTGRLWIVTRGAQPVEDLALVGLRYSPLWGLGRVLAQEHPGLWGGMIDLDPSCAAEENAAALLADLDDGENEDQIAYRHGARFVARLERKGRLTKRRNFEWRADAGYLITGGLGDLGLKVARWMVGQGARHLILLSRTRIPPREQWGFAEAGSRLERQVRALAEIEGQGAKVLVDSVDVADESQLFSFLTRYRSAGGAPIRGVVHAAGVVEMKPLMELDASALDAVLRSKITGAWLLHRLLAGDELDFFVMFSSFASLLSSPQLGAYAAANAFLDCLAHHRRAENRMALAVNWAAWSDVGMAARYVERGQVMAQGATSFTPTEGLAVLEALMSQDSPQVGVMRVDWRFWRKLYPVFSKSPVMSELMREKASADDERERYQWEPIRELLLDAKPAMRQGILEGYLHELAARVLRIPSAKLDAQRSLTTLGLDSLMAVELRTRVDRDLEVTLPLVELLQGPSVTQLAGKLLEQVVMSALSRADRVSDISAIATEWETLTL